MRWGKRESAATPWPADRPVRFVTSFNETLFAASGLRCVESVRRHNPSYELRAYLEARPDDVRQIAGDVAALGAEPIDISRLPALGAFLELARDVIPVELGGDAPSEMFPGEGPATGDVWFRKHMFRWFRKIVALEHAAVDFGDILFWLDCDCEATAPLPREVLERSFAGRGVVMMKARRQHTETGLVGYDLAAPGVRELLATMKEHYMSRAFERFPRWDDCATLDHCLQLPGAPSARDVARRVLAHGEVLPATPFAPYLRHHKGLHSRGLGLTR